jgi:Cytochrome P460
MIDNLRIRRGIRLAMFVLPLTVVSSMARQPAAVPYPTDYRSWAVVKTSLVSAQAPNFATRGGFHHFYANAKAMDGYRTGSFPEGSIIVDEGVYAEDAKGVMVERGRRSLDVMHKHGETHAATGGWGFEHFDGDSQVGSGTAEARAACATCHGQRKAQDYVFSTFRK